jgi:hypothetical protein
MLAIEDPERLATVLGISNVDIECGSKERTAYALLSDPSASWVVRVLGKKNRIRHESARSAELAPNPLDSTTVERSLPVFHWRVENVSRYRAVRCVYSKARHLGQTGEVLRLDESDEQGEAPSPGLDDFL